MAGIDDSGGIAGDWMQPSPTTRAFLSAFLSDSSGLRSNSTSSVENRSDGFFLNAQGPPELETGEKDVMPAGIPRNQVTQSNSFSDQRSSRGGLVERMAARAGFNAPRLNTESIKSSDLLIATNPSPYLTIPPGLSPTTLLESPVFLSNSLAQPSPTTGKFPFIPYSNNKTSVIPEAYDKNKDNFFDDIESSSFSFKPSSDSDSESLFINQTSKSNPAGLSRQSFPSTGVLVQSDNSLCTQIADPTRDVSRSSAEKDPGVDTIAKDQRVLGSATGYAENSPPLDEQKDEGDQKGNGDSAVVTAGGGAPSEDGYNWRKYGQKQVKGSEFPRSYYKCTHPNCQVKKKVERSHEGHITEIIYKGEHNHPLPPPNRRTAIGSSNPHDMQFEFPEQVAQHSGVDGDLTWENLHKENGHVVPDLGNDNMEVTSPASAGPDFCNPTPSLQPQNSSQLVSGDAVDASSTFSNNNEDEDDRGTHGSVSLAYDGEGEESESKRRKLEVYPTDMSGASRAVREPRVVVQTISEVDILDDGYRWRKYGQKVVKGNPNPRSYYKCTSPGCNVRKHVERASHDLKSVITTYEGKHNHDVPAARNSSHVNSSAALQMNQATSVQTQAHRSEASQVHNGMARFERPPLNPFVLPGRQQLGHVSSFPYGMNQPSLSNMAKAGFGHGQGKMPYMPPFHPLLAQRPLNDMGFMLPKKEPKAETLLEPIHQFSNKSGVQGQGAPWTSNVN